MNKILIASLLAAALGGCGNPQAAQIMMDYNRSVQNNRVDYSAYQTPLQPIGGNTYNVRPGFGPGNYIVERR